MTTSTGGTSSPAVPRSQRVRDDMLKCDFMRFTVTDIHGIARGRSITRQHLPNCLDEGASEYSGVIALGPRGQVTPIDKDPHPEGKGDGDVIAKPILSTYHSLPWAGGPKHNVAEVFCETIWRDGSNMEACPRYVARRQLERLGKMGFSILSGWEAAFYLQDQQTATKPAFSSNREAQLLLAKHEEFFYDMMSLMRQAGIDLEGIRMDSGPDQAALTTKSHDGLKGVDMALSLKQAAKEIAWQRGYQATFMTKPYIDEVASSLLQNMSILDTKNYNVINDRNRKYGLSDFGQHWVAGMIRHCAALTALCCPTVNCYRRLHSAHSPSTATWGFENREALIRVKFGPKGCYLENRLPSSACNPYLAMAGCIAAGMDGVAKRLKCPPEMDKAAKELPRTLDQALEALEVDDVMVEALSFDFVHWFLVEKRRVELEELESCNPKSSDPELFQKERDMYFKFV